jgi:hypothetical protein
MDEPPFFQEGFLLLKRAVSHLYPQSKILLDSDSTGWAITLETASGYPTPPDISRLVSLTTGLESYTLTTLHLESSGATSRMAQALISNTKEDPMKHVYVLSCYAGPMKHPLGSFSTRDEAEHMVTSQKLLGRLSETQKHAFDRVIVERWRLGEILEGDHVKWLTTFNLDGTVLVKLPEEGEPDADPLQGRMSSILSRVP